MGGVVGGVVLRTCNASGVDCIVLYREYHNEAENPSEVIEIFIHLLDD